MTSTDEVSNLIFATTRPPAPPEDHRAEERAHEEPRDAAPVAADVVVADDRDALIASLREELAEALARPTGEARGASAAATRLLELATSSADELVAEAKAEAAFVVAAAHTEADEVRAETERRREQQAAELEEQRSAALTEISERRESLLGQVAKLRDLENEQRESMRVHLQAQLALLESSEPAALLAVAGD